MIRARLAMWLLAAVLLGGCGCCCGDIGFIGPSPDLTAEDVVGTYEGPGDSTVTLKSDGTFTAAGLHDCGRNGYGEFDGPDGGHGTWELQEPETMTPTQRLELEFEAPEPFGWLDWEADEEQIFFYQGDPDSGNLCFLDKVA